MGLAEGKEQLGKRRIVLYAGSEFSGLAKCEGLGRIQPCLHGSPCSSNIGDLLGQTLENPRTITQTRRKTYLLLFGLSQGKKGQGLPPVTSAQHQPPGPGKVFERGSER